MTEKDNFTKHIIVCYFFMLLLARKENTYFWEWNMDKYGSVN